MKILDDKLKTGPVIYVTRDQERAMGLPAETPGYFIVCNKDEYTEKNKIGNILFIDNKEKLDTQEILTDIKSFEFIVKKSNPQVLVFKNTKLIEKICVNNGWKLLNPSADLSNQVEEKISQVKWLEELQKFLPPHQITTLDKIVWKGEKFILQFNRAHTGSGTILIEKQEHLSEIQKKFPKREVKITEFVNGPMLTSNNIVSKEKILIGNISYQITGLKPFTNQSFSTIGNDWGFAPQHLSAKNLSDYQKITNAIGEKLKKSGWKGLFGVDIIFDQKNDNLYLIEINARQPASTTYESQLQMLNKKNDNEITVFEAHLAALLDIDLDNFELIKINQGAQIIQREINNKQLTINKKDIENELINNNFKVIVYNNTKENADLIRIQSKNNIMEEHNVLNSDGIKIKEIIEKTL